MNYQKIYNQIIDNRKANPIKNGYVERHHILPRSLGGTDDSENLVTLSAREHFLCHYLLTKIYPQKTQEYKKMLFAFMLMKANSDNQKRYFNSRLYEEKRIEFSNYQKEKQKGINNSQYGTLWYTNGINEIKITDVTTLPQGYERGRLSRYKKKKELELKKEEYKKSLGIQQKENIFIYTEYYKIYNKHGWNNFKKLTKYEYSQQNLVMQFKKYVKDYKPQNGKIRGIVEKD